MRVLVTGASGFVGYHLINALETTFGRDILLLPTAKKPLASSDSKIDEVLDVTCRHSVDEVIKRHKPTHVIHLAGIASPVAAATNPDLAWRVHLEGTRNVALSLLTYAPNCTLVNAGSGLIYGESAKSGDPLDENAVLAPLDDYGASKAAADISLGALAHSGLHVLRMRPFNHIGPGQTEEFVATAFAMQIARIEKALQPPVIAVGNLNAVRDFLDVRDVVAAYVSCLTVSQQAPAIFNLGSGQPHSIAEILHKLIDLSGRAIEITLDPSRQRASEVPRIVANAQKARKVLRWQPRYSLEETLAEVLEDCRRRVALES